MEGNQHSIEDCVESKFRRRRSENETGGGAEKKPGLSKQLGIT